MEPVLGSWFLVLGSPATRKQGTRNIHLQVLGSAFSGTRPLTFDPRLGPVKMKMAGWREEEMRCRTRRERGSVVTALQDRKSNADPAHQQPSPLGCRSFAAMLCCPRESRPQGVLPLLCASPGSKTPGTATCLLVLTGPRCFISHTYGLLDGAVLQLSIPPFTNIFQVCLPGLGL